MRYTDEQVAAGEYGSEEMRADALEALRNQTFADHLFDLAKELAEVQSAEATMRAQLRAAAEIEAYREAESRAASLVDTRWLFLGSPVRVTEVDAASDSLSYVLTSGSYLGRVFESRIGTFRSLAERLPAAGAILR